MNLDLRMFIEFPGILITIGMILLIISIVIIIIIYKSESKVIDASLLKESENDYQNQINNEIYNNDVVPTEPQIEEAPKEEPQEVAVTQTLQNELNNLVNEAMVTNFNVPKESLQENQKEEVQEVKQVEEEPVINAFDEEFKDETNKQEEKTQETKQEHEEEEIELL